MKQQQIKLRLVSLQADYIDQVLEHVLDNCQYVSDETAVFKDMRDTMDRGVIKVVEFIKYHKQEGITCCISDINDDKAILAAIGKLEMDENVVFCSRILSVPHTFKYDEIEWFQPLGYSVKNLLQVPDDIKHIWSKPRS